MSTVSLPQPTKAERPPSPEPKQAKEKPITTRQHAAKIALDTALELDSRNQPEHLADLLAKILQQPKPHAQTISCQHRMPPRPDPQEGRPDAPRTSNHTQSAYNERGGPPSPTKVAQYERRTK